MRRPVRPEAHRLMGWRDVSRAERVMERNNAGSAPHCDGNTRARASDSVTTLRVSEVFLKRSVRKIWVEAFGENRNRILVVM
ncbi:MAG: hypothetical protein US42_C0009G0050 [Candidatus Magasanikbacteria bacterium GW2011_GWC2_37_14]|uniref:Uncharacterized protein n=1 Tax=Candidatus Magasanikbacteria bacterium GW2011_GWC2_37_14 TaxID=1619046 RepID=A0A0G0GMS6_9BACT|nr:MAG: hypothetical protein US42_C0009G0050 [Candidatus Magasanikbacteria bacterium GW2011_GWC2_37_14]